MIKTPSVTQPSPLNSRRSRLISSIGLSVALLLSQAVTNESRAQEAPEAALDSNEMEILKLIQQGQASLKKSKSSRVRRSSKRKKTALKEALKSFSFAHRFMTDLQLSNPSLTEQINAGYTEALSDPLIQQELKTQEANLTKALAKRDKESAYEAALELSNLDARSREYMYLMKVFSTLQPQK